MFAVGAVAEIAMNCENSFRDFHNFVGRKKSDDIRKARISLRVAVTAAKPAADAQVVADKLVVLDDGDEAEAVREQIQIVHRRNDKCDFEFAWQIRFAVKRINKIFVFRRVVVQLHAVNPDGMIRLRLRRERERNFVRVGKNLFARFRVSGRGRREDIAIYVAASRERREQALVNFRNERTQTGHHDAVKLNALARGDS